ncbi:MAG TPA: alpha/beta fold hydrolase, partial [Actinomycetes bacterium]|nr:alpha/beta fold hydrolase [Actinomycetes bacterium]
MRRWLMVVACAALLLTGCTSDEPEVEPSPVPTPSIASLEPDALSEFYEQTADWSECGQFECATIDAPLSYEDPDGRTINLSMLKRVATNEDDKIGTLFINPGGPGVSGVEYARLADVLFTKPVLDNYDIVGWDPRGVGESTSINCLTDEETDTFLAADGTPDTSAEVVRLARLNAKFTRGCVTDDAELIPHLGTFSSARDMDLLRSSVGEQKLNYFGASYG